MHGSGERDGRERGEMLCTTAQGQAGGRVREAAVLSPPLILHSRVLQRAVMEDEEEDEPRLRDVELEVVFSCFQRQWRFVRDSRRANNELFALRELYEVVFFVENRLRWSVLALLLFASERCREWEPATDVAAREVAAAGVSELKFLDLVFRDRFCEAMQSFEFPLEMDFCHIFDDLCPGVWLLTDQCIGLLKDHQRWVANHNLPFFFRNACSFVESSLQYCCCIMERIRGILLTN